MLFQGRLLRRILAGGVLASVGCQESVVEVESKADGPLAKPTTTPVARKARFETEYRIVEFEVEAAAFRNLSDRIEATGGISNQIRDSRSMKYAFQAWMDPKTLPSLMEIEGVVKSMLISPTTIVEPPRRRGLQSAVKKLSADGYRSFYVILGPNSWAVEKSSENYETTEEITAGWMTQFRDIPDVLVEPVEAKFWTEIRNERGRGYVGPVEGQVKFSVFGGEVSPQLLQTIGKHPQVMRVQWDQPMAIYGCPGCGLG